MAWTAVCSAVLFGTMKFFRMLRVSRSVEKAGIDRVQHGEPAYPSKSYADGEEPGATIHDCK